MIHGPIRKVFNSFVLSGKIPMFFGPFATALTSIPTLTPAATVLERAAGNFLERDLCNLIIVLSWISTSLNFASFSMEIAKAAGIQTRIAGTIGEDHQWNEVLINKTWVHVDPTLDNASNFDIPHFYENKWKWNLSKVYALNNGEQIDVTETYFEKIGYLNVTVIKKGGFAFQVKPLSP